MNDCPNCGSPVRPGAKFCTTCGFRLAESETGGWADESRQPAFDPVGTLAASEWAQERQPAPDQSASGTGEDAGAADRPLADAWNDPTWLVGTAAESETASADERTSEPGDDQPAMETEERQQAWESPLAAEAEPAADAGLPDVQPFDLDQPDEREDADSAFRRDTAGVPSGGIYAGMPDQDAAASEPAALTEPADEAWRPATVADERDSVATGEDELASAVDALATGDERDQGVDETAPTGEAEWMDDDSAPDGTAAAAAVAAEEMAWDTAPAHDADQAPAPSQEADQAAGAAALAPATATVPADMDGEALDRATRLLDELRDLLPALATAAPSVDRGTDYAAVARDLADAGSSDYDEDYADLRQAVETARDRPRDIDAMLDLSLRLDAIGRLLDDHDRARQAIERAVAALGDGNDRG